MILAMSRPWKHLKSGVYWLRKRVPDDLRKLVGKREEKRSLLTRDASEAKRRHAWSTDAQDFVLNRLWAYWLPRVQHLRSCQKSTG